ncbi:uncharacterized protein LOC116033219 [Ipomoea triloba]|uniref:uncharacterized protein LOC116033219 n=1 Tax=Ipomoea triloba TaxID=35885 RepID=UPI00125DCB26|nr:uncharacterized protein LOC116033219 [Ipomoea triloba]
MGVFLLPVGLCKEIEKVMNSFWWKGGKRENKGIHWKSWDKLCHPKKWGGMGFRSLRDFNLAMLSKQSWRLINNQTSLAAQIFRARYYPNSSFLEAKLGTNSSFIWSSLVQTQDIIRKHSKWRVGNGSNINIWTEDWLPDKQNPKVCSFPYPLMEDAKVADLIVPGQNRWDEEMVRIIFSERDANLIMSIPLPKQQSGDKVI